MKRWLPLSILLLGLLIVVASCGGGATTTSTASSTTTSLATTTAAPTTTASSATSSSTGGGTSTTTGVTVPPLSVQLTGDQVVPPVQTQATGTLALTVSLTSGIGYKLDVQNITDVIAAGIYLGAKGSNGTLVVILVHQPPSSGTFSGTLAQGTITDADLTGPLQGKSIQDLIPQMIASGGGAYVQVTTKAHPAGEIRGEITP